MSNTRQKPTVSLRLPDELEGYLREQAKASFRSLTNEIVMRLQKTRDLDRQPMPQTGGLKEKLQ